MDTSANRVAGPSCRHSSGSREAKSPAPRHPARFEVVNGLMRDEACVRDADFLRRGFGCRWALQLARCLHPSASPPSMANCSYAAWMICKSGEARFHGNCETHYGFDCRYASNACWRARLWSTIGRG
jgi:hypothetical protein